jgi:hypothetical protein
MATLERLKQFAMKLYKYADAQRAAEYSPLWLILIHSPVVRILGIIREALLKIEGSDHLQVPLQQQGYLSLMNTRYLADACNGKRKTMHIMCDTLSCVID